MLARGGRVGSGFVTRGPQAIVGEGRQQHPEFVIPTDPMYRGRAMQLYAALGSKLGTAGPPMLEDGGILGWIGGGISSAWRGVTGFAKGVGDKLGDAMSWLGGTISGATGGLSDEVLRAVGDMLPGEPWRGMGSGLARTIFDGISKSITDSFAASGGGDADVSGIPTVANGTQLQNAAIIASVARRMGFARNGLVVALATALQESGLRNLNYGDRDSVGLFQQRTSQGWGTIAQIMNPAYSAMKFFSALRGVRGWEAMPVTVAAQRVQRSAFPNAYQKWVPLANSLASQVGYAGGGRIPGLPSVAGRDNQTLIAQAGERVLTVEQNAAFERMVAALERQGAAGGADRQLVVNVSQVAGDPQETARFTALALRGVA